MGERGNGRELGEGLSRRFAPHKDTKHLLSSLILTEYTLLGSGLDEIKIFLSGTKEYPTVVVG